MKCKICSGGEMVFCNFTSACLGIGPYKYECNKCGCSVFLFYKYDACNEFNYEWYDRKMNKIIVKNVEVK